MALRVTQCPSCESTFNTSAPMLEAAHGLVRCGACFSVFEADKNFVSESDPATGKQQEPPAPHEVFISGAEDYFDPSRFLKDTDLQIENIIHVTYEEMTANPGGVTREITDFLGLEPIDDSLLNTNWFVRDKNEPIKNMNTRSFERLSAQDIDDIEKIAGPMLLKHGYQRPTPAQN